MAVVNYNRTQLNAYRTEVYRWTAIPQNENGNAVEIPRSADKSVHIKGTFGGATVHLKGSNDADGASYVILKDALGVLISLTAEDIRQVLPSPLLVRPEVVGGDGTTAITVTIVSRV